MSHTKIILGLLLADVSAVRMYTGPAHEAAQKSADIRAAQLAKLQALKGSERSERIKAIDAELRRLQAAGVNAAVPEKATRDENAIMERRKAERQRLRDAGMVLSESDEVDRTEVEESPIEWGDFETGGSLSRTPSGIPSLGRTPRTPSLGRTPSLDSQDWIREAQEHWDWEDQMREYEEQMEGTVCVHDDAHKRMMSPKAIQRELEMRMEERLRADLERVSSSTALLRSSSGGF